MDWIHGLIAQYSAAIKVDPILATLLIPVIGGIMFYVKGLPTVLWAFLVRWTTVTMTLNNAGWDGNADAYNAFDKWFMQSGYKSFSRNFFMFRQYKEDLFGGEMYRHYRLGIGKGTHIFFYQKKLFWFQKGALNSSGSEKEKEEITVRTFGWNHRVFEKLVTLFNQKKTGSNHIAMHKYVASTGWEEIGTVPVRDIATFCMNEEIKAEIIGKIEFFISRREWYAKKGLAYKTSFMFKGPPGTGKTTLAKLLGMHFRRDMYLLDLSQHSNSSLVDALGKVKPGSILLMEDVDQAGKAVQKRDKNEKKSTGKLAEVAPAAPTLSLDLSSDMFGLTMSGMLNAFDGVISLDNMITFFTTNHPEDLDPAIRRKSRIDNEYEIGLLTGIEIYRYMQQMYDDFEGHAAQDTIRRYLTNSQIELEGCEVENAFKENADSPEAFVEDITQRANKKLRLVA